MRNSQYVKDLIRLFTIEEILKSRDSINQFMPKNAKILHRVALRKLGVKS